MQYICILGDYTSYNEQIYDKLVKMGFKPNNICATRGHKGMTLLTEDKFDELVSENKVIPMEKKGDTKYGLINPYGVDKYISIVPIEYFEKLREIYGEQVLGFYISTNEDLPQIIVDNASGKIPESHCIIIIYDEILGINSIIAEILKRVK